MLDQVLLLDEQRELLRVLVEASRRQAREDRRPFLLTMTSDGQHVIHSSLPGGFIASTAEDVETLARHGLVSAKRPQKYTISFYVTPEGYAYYERMKTRGRGPVDQVVEDVRQLVDSEAFQARYPMAHRKWTDAESRLWAAPGGDLSTIGHLCREAMQEFATSLVETFKAEDAPSEKTKDVGRIKAVVASQARRLGITRTAFMEALITYWGALTDMVQRQEHAAAKVGEPVTWEDARSVVLHTLVVFAEFDRSLT